LRANFLATKALALNALQPLIPMEFVMSEQLTRSILDYVASTDARLPGLWQACEQVRKNYPQPPQCYLTDYFAIMAIAKSMRAAGHEQAFNTLVSHVDAASAFMPIATIANWRMTQGIYCVDSALYPELISTPITNDLPIEVLLRLPEWCIYISTPGVFIHSVGSGRPVELRGCFVRIDVSDRPARAAQEFAPPRAKRAPYDLVLALDIPDASGQLLCASMQINGSVNYAIENLMTTRQATAFDTREFLNPIFNMLLYICAMGDISGKSGQPGNPQPTKLGRGEAKLVPAKGPRIWDVGVQMGEALRAANVTAINSNRNSRNASDRSHLRRAHWHCFRSGPLKRSDGSVIPSNERKLELQWIPPTMVSVQNEQVNAQALQAVRQLRTRSKK
jgi:hypothetical protein